VTRRPGLEGALLGTGFPFRDLTHLDLYLAIFRELLTRTAGIRRAGCAALDLAYVACGRLDGFWEFGLKEWDMAAGTLLIREAGGAVSDLEGGEDFLAKGEVAGGNLKVHGAMLEVIRGTGAPHRLTEEAPPTPGVEATAELAPPALARPEQIAESGPPPEPGKPRRRKHRLTRNLEANTSEPPSPPRPRPRSPR
jgi:hypothetical protein